MNYQNLTRAEKRKAVGEDMLKYRPSLKLDTGSYIFVKHKLRGCNTLKKVLDRNIECTVCAIGAVICSITNINEDLPLSIVNNRIRKSRKVKQLLTEILTLEELLLIEALFEPDLSFDYTLSKHYKIGFNVDFFQIRELGEVRT